MAIKIILSHFGMSFPQDYPKIATLIFGTFPRSTRISTTNYLVKTRSLQDLIFSFRQSSTFTLIICRTVMT